MEIKDLTCPTCGAPVKLRTRFVQVAVCEYCNQTLVIQDDKIDPTGKTAKMTQYPTPFSIGRYGALKGTEFEVIGRVRYEYDEGWWDEWCLSIGGEKLIWIEEDEGLFRSFERIRIKAAIKPWDDVFPGSTIEINKVEVFVTEKNEAKIIGAEGNLTVKRVPGTTMKYLDGTGNEQQYTIEFYEKSITLKSGEDLERGHFAFKAE